MLQWFLHIPIFLRLFLAFFLAAFVPDIIIIVEGNDHMQDLNAYHVDSAQIQSLIAETIFALIITTITVIVLGFIINSTITRRLRHLVILTRQVSQGEIEKRAIITGKDEIYIVAISMNAMLDSIEHLIQETQAQRDGLQDHAKRLVAEVQSIGEKALPIWKMSASANAMETLGQSLNYLIAEHNSLIARTKKQTRDVGISAVNMHEQATELVEFAETQMQQITTAADESMRVTHACQQVAGHIQALDNVAKSMYVLVSSERTTTQQATLSMEQISANVQAMSSRVHQLSVRAQESFRIVKVVSDISRQMQRLSLDAALQTAMAGENGKIFGVIANDIRNLSEWSKEHILPIAQNIQGISEDVTVITDAIDNLQRNVAREARQIHDTDEVLEKTCVQMERQVRMVDLINSLQRGSLRSLSSIVEVLQGGSQLAQQSNSTIRVVRHNLGYVVESSQQFLASIEAAKFELVQPAQKIDR